jgi:chromosome segregation ATPase
MSKQSESSAIQEITRKVQQLESLLADAIREDGATSQKVRNLNSELEGVLHILTTDFPGLVSDLLLVAEEERVLREECEAALQAIKTQWKSEISTLTATIGRLAKLDCLDTQSDDVVSLRRRIAELESECETLRGIINETTKGP